VQSKMRGVVWRRLAVWKMKKHLESEIFGEDVVLENFRCFDLAVRCIIEPKNSVFPQDITKEVVKAVYYVMGSRPTIVTCLEEALKLRERERRAWPFPLTIRWVVPSLSATRALYRLLARFVEAVETDEIENQIYVWSGQKGRDEPCMVKAVAEEGGGEPDTLVLLSPDGEELGRISLYRESRLRGVQVADGADGKHFTRNCVRFKRMHRKVETSSPKRVLESVLEPLREKPRYLSELDRELGITRNWLSGFLAGLEALGIVNRRGTATFKIYELKGQRQRPSKPKAPKLLLKPKGFMQPLNQFNSLTGFA